MCKYCASDGGGFQDSLMNWDREHVEYNQAALYRYILLQLSPGLHLLILYRNSALPHSFMRDYLSPSNPFSFLLLFVKSAVK